MTSVPSPQTITAGTAFTAAQGNSWRDSCNWCLSNHPMAVLRSSGTQSINNSSSTAVLLDVEDIDSDSGHSLVTNTSRYTSPTAGWFLITAYVPFAANATGLRQLEIRVNGSGITLSSTPTVGAGVATHCSTSTHYFLNGSTDFVEMFAFQTSGGALNIGGQCRLTLEWRRNL